MAQPKATFSLDADTLRRLELAADQVGKSKSEVVREAVADYAARLDRLSETERLRMLRDFDELVRRIPARSAAAVDRELTELRRARRAGGRRSSGERQR
jgi:predicted DNA-binding protein